MENINNINNWEEIEERDNKRREKLKRWWPRLAMLAVTLGFVLLVLWITAPGTFTK